MHIPAIIDKQINQDCIELLKVIIITALFLRIWQSSSNNHNAKFIEAFIVNVDKHIELLKVITITIFFLKIWPNF